MKASPNETKSAKTPRRRPLFGVAAALFAAGLWACGPGGEKPAGDHDHDHGDHAHDHDHEGEEAHDHEHEGEEAHDHGGDPHALGSASADGLDVSATQLGDLKVGGENVFKLSVAGGEVAAVRLWAGDEPATHSVKALAELDDEEMGIHAHVEIPAELADADKLWAEIELADGKAVRVSFDLKR